MVQTKKKSAESKTIALLLSVLLVVVHTLNVPACDVGICEGAGYARAIYPFFHASWTHLAMNIWGMLCIVFYYDIRVSAMIVAYMIAILFPVDLLSSLGADLSLPTVGLSGVCFALIGDCSGIAADKRQFHSYMAVLLICGFLLPHVNSWLHLWCYSMGCFFGYNSWEEEI